MKKAMNELDRMKSDTERYSGIIKDCIGKLQKIRLKSRSGSFRRDMADVLKTVKMAAYYKYSYQGAPCNPLDWIAKNFDYYGDADKGAEMMDEMLENYEKRRESAPKGNGWKYVQIYWEGDEPKMITGELEDDDDIIFEDGDTVRMCGSSYITRYNDGDEAAARRRLIEFAKADEDSKIKECIRIKNLYDNL